MKSAKKVFKTTFALIGSIVGAGFISGREIITFFAGNIFVSCLVVFVIFSLAFYFLLSIKFEINSTFLVYFQPIVLVGNLIIFSGMISAIDEIFSLLTGLKFQVPTLSIIVVAVSFFLSGKGINVIRNINSILVPIVIVVSILILAPLDKQICGEYSVKFLGKLIFYVGMNAFMSSTLIIDCGKDLSNIEAFFCAIFASLVICSLIFLFHSRLSVGGALITKDGIPLISLIGKNKTLKYVISTIMIFGIGTTIIANNYILFCFAKTFQKQKIAKLIILISAFAISRLGFYKIVEYCYPIIGLIGVIYLVILAILSNISRRAQRQNT